LGLINWQEVSPGLVFIFFAKQEKPVVFLLQAFFKIWHRPTLPRVTAVPSALVGLTSLFGMGRGGHHRYRHLNIFNVI